MMKKKLKLGQLRVESFITNLDTKKVMGGESIAKVCVNTDDSIDTNPVITRCANYATETAPTNCICHTYGIPNKCDDLTIQVSGTIC